MAAQPGALSEPDVANSSRAALRVAHVSKGFGGTLALDDVSLEIEHGETLALLGHNGSGKSTLIKILAGFHQPDGPAEGWVDNQPFTLGSAEDSAGAGLRFVHQDLGLVHELDAVDNVALVTGYIKTRSGRIDRTAMIERTTQLLGRFEINLDVTQLLSAATPVQRTGVAIARALWDWEEATRRILVLDEPTASLPSREVDRLFELVHSVRQAGHGVIYVTHRMDEVFRVADKVVVLRAGRVVDTSDVKNQTPERLARLIAGEELRETELATQRPAPVQGNADEFAIRVSGLSGRYIREVSLEVRPGEILGVAGLQGSGRDELPYLLAGAIDPSADGARWELGGKPAVAPTTATAIGMGIAFVPADRKREGLLDGFTVGENLSLAAMGRLRRNGLLSGRVEREFVLNWMRQMGVPEHVVDHPINTLSGGNQQRILLAKWFCTQPTLMIVSDPTAGVDVGARRAVHELILERAATGLAVIVASSDVQDLVEISSRVVVLRHGVIAEELQGDEIGRHRMLMLMEESG